MPTPTHCGTWKEVSNGMYVCDKPHDGHTNHVSTSFYDGWFYISTEPFRWISDPWDKGKDYSND